MVALCEFDTVAQEGDMITEYRISSRWRLQSPMQALLDAVVRAFTYPKRVKHQGIPLTETSRHHLLGCQLEQSLLGDWANRNLRWSPGHPALGGHAARAPASGDPD